MLFALLLGMALHFLSADPRAAEGIDFTAKKLLRVGIALLGARITFGQVADLGAAPVAIVVICLSATIGFGLLLARFTGRGWPFGILTAGSVAICGASAALAISAVLPRSESLERDTLFTVVAVTGLSTVAMVVYPILFAALGFDETAIGILIGATIHDVAQVVGAGYAVSNEAGDAATLVKLLRVALVAGRGARPCRPGQPKVGRAGANAGLRAGLRGDPRGQQLRPNSRPGAGRHGRRLAMAARRGNRGARDQDLAPGDVRGRFPATRSSFSPRPCSSRRSQPSFWPSYERVIRCSFRQQNLVQAQPAPAARLDGALREPGPAASGRPQSAGLSGP